MQLTITCTVPDEWRDYMHESGVLSAPYGDIETVLIRLGAEDVEIQATD